MTSNEYVVLADADNTLWDTDSVFADAQLQLLSKLEEITQHACIDQDRLAFVRAYDQALAVRHHLHLRYPPQMLVAALAAGLASSCAPDEVTADIISGRHSVIGIKPPDAERALATYVAALANTAQLLPSVREGLDLAKTAGLAIYVMTEGRVDKQRRILAAHNLIDVFSGVWEFTKNREQFERLRRRFDRAEVVVIGDQVDRDIVPAHQAGCRTILVPSRFRPKWQNQNEYQLADLIAKDFLEAICWTIARALPPDAAVGVH